MSAVASGTSSRFCILLTCLHLLQSMLSFSDGCVFFSPPPTPTPLWFSVQLEAFYSIFTTEQQDHVKSVEYLRNNFRPQQALNDRVVSKSAVRDAWNHDMADFLDNPFGTEASKGMLGLRALTPSKIPYHKSLTGKRSSEPANHESACGTNSQCFSAE